MRYLSVLLGSCLVMALSAAFAGAATMSVTKTTVSVGGMSFFVYDLTYKAADGESNDLDVTYDSSSGQYTFIDSGAGSIRISGDTDSVCAIPPAHTDPTVICDFNGSLTINLEDQLDIAVLGTIDSISGDVTINGGSGSDYITGTAGADTINGEKGSDAFTPGLGADKVTGGSGTDLVNYEDHSSGVTVDSSAGGGNGNATEDDGGDTFTDDIESLYGSDSNDRLTGSDVSDTIYGFEGDDVIIGGTADEYILPGKGSDTVTGGDSNNDVVSYLDHTVRGVTVDMAPGSTGNGNSREDGAEGDTFTDEIDQVYGSQLDDVISQSGDEYTSGYVVFGYGGDDSLNGGNDSDIFYGGEGADEITGNGGDSDYVIYSDHTSPVEVKLAIGSGNGNTTEDGAGDTFHDDIETVMGTDYDDVLEGDDSNDRFSGEDGDDTITGNGGDDYISGSDGADTLVGGAGDDEFVPNVGEDVITGGDGTDSVSYVYQDAGVTVNLAAGSGNGNTVEDGDDGDTFVDDIENAAGTNYVDRIVGTEQANNINGLGEADTLIGNGGQDSIYASTGDDIVYTGSEDNTQDGDLDYVSCSEGIDTVYYEDHDTSDGQCEDSIRFATISDPAPIDDGTGDETGQVDSSTTSSPTTSSGAGNSCKIQHTSSAKKVHLSKRLSFKLVGPKNGYINLRGAKAAKFKVAFSGKNAKKVVKNAVFILDGKKLAVDKKYPFTYSLSLRQTTGLSTGKHTLQVKLKTKRGKKKSFKARSTFMVVSC